MMNQPKKQLDFIKLIPTDRIIFVGDSKQQIYSFRGADPEVFDKLKKTYNPTVFKMTQSFRCPDGILDLVSEIVPNIWSDITQYNINNANVTNIVFPSDCLIICRVNSELINLARIFIQKNIKFSIGQPAITAIRIPSKNA